MRVRRLVWGVRWRRLAQLLRVAALPVIASAARAQAAGPSVALYYGANPPVEALSSFDVVVVEPDGQFDPHAHPPSRTQWFAYVSVGEVNPHRTYYPSMPRAWMPGVNEAWASHVVDQTAAGWPAFFVERVVTPLWNKGYRGFFLDTLDSYQLIVRTDAARAALEAGLVKVIRAVKARYPQAKLIFSIVVSRCCRRFTIWLTWWRSNRCIAAGMQASSAIPKCRRRTASGYWRRQGRFVPDTGCRCCR